MRFVLTPQTSWGYLEASDRESVGLLALRLLFRVCCHQGACQAYVQAALGNPAQAAAPAGQELEEGGPAQADEQPEATTEDFVAGLDGSAL